ncbi:MAG: Glycosyl transferase family 2 [Candidatus Gottesmanbacteria bacterium GW2011_GWC2_39_8]|uniref:Glycosyl transferase family 2 n=1 Tax=Candidatus Gottesmanbacteria bacterium GW2011_GWC2_39_8 TaxID=1618450 RepID=A0A0G0Q1Q4_9BACT|nr:MAG: Glycosyl transferase family 2 [Candidatus Gottesmanbacteria bacterium GW2011_GWC2_39_8]
MSLSKQNLNNRKPLVSIIMPVYNAGDFLWEAITSVLKQTYANFELIAINDGSTDKSLKMLKAIAKKDKRIKVLSIKENGGLGIAGNLGIKQTKGKYLSRFDADDIMPQDRLEKQVKYMEEYPGVVALGGQCILVDDRGKEIGRKEFPLADSEIKKMSFYAMSLQAGTMMINRKRLPRNFVYYSSNYRYAEDHELLFRLFDYGKLANLPDNLLFYRQHDYNSTKIVDPKAVFKKIYKIRKKWLKRYYHAGLTEHILNIVQYFIVTILPTNSIPRVFEILRGMKPLIPVINFSMDISKFILRSTSKAYLTFKNYLF